MTDVLCIGELLVEFVADTSNVSLSGSPGFIKAPGGAPANVAVALSRLGVSSGFMGKVGDDPFGLFLQECLAENKVDIAALFLDPDVRTTAVFTAVWDDGHKDLCFYRNPGADMMLRPEEIDESSFSDLRCFHFGSISFINEPSCGAQRKALEFARRHKTMISYDPNYRPTLWPNEELARQTIQEAYRYCHLAKISEEEWQVATGYDDFEAGVKAVLDKGVELLIVSKGDKGSMATNGEYLIEAPALAVDVVETTGAGDAFLAAVMAGSICVYGVLDTSDIRLNKDRAPYNFNLLVHQWPTREYEAAAHEPICGWIGEGRLRFEDFITTEFKINRIRDAVDCVKHKKALKVALRF